MKLWVQSILWLWLLCSFSSLYAFILVYIAVLTRLGFIIIGLGIAPIVIIWYRAVSRKIQRYIEALTKPASKFPSDEEIEEIINTLRNRKR